jgi:hypothetical protein
MTTTWAAIAWCWNMPRPAEPRWHQCDDAPYSLDEVRELIGFARGAKARPGAFAAQMRTEDRTYLLFKQVA